MLWLVKANFARARHFDCGYRSPPRLRNFAANDSTRFEVSHGGAEIVTHEVEFVAWRFAFRSGMNGKLCGWQSKDQPAVAGVHGTKTQDIAEKGADLVGVLGMDEGMESVDHLETLPRPPEKAGRE